MIEYAKFNPETLNDEFEKFLSTRDSILPILHHLSNLYGYISDEAVPKLADYLNMSVAEVLGVINFYDDFRSTPPGRKVVKICRAEACRALGSHVIETHAKQKFNIDYHETAKDESVTLEGVYCFGNCSCGPTVMIDDQIYGRMNPEKFDQLT